MTGFVVQGHIFSHNSNFISDNVKMGLYTI